MMITKDGIRIDKLAEPVSAMVSRREVGLLVSQYERDIRSITGEDEIFPVSRPRLAYRVYASRRIKDFMESGIISAERYGEICDSLDSEASKRGENRKCISDLLESIADCFNKQALD